MQTRSVVERVRAHLALVLLLLGSIAPAKDLTVRFCRIVNDWRSSKYTPHELCERHKGNFCYLINAEAQAVCQAAGVSYCTSASNLGQALCLAGQAPSCFSVKNTSQGICLVLGENGCLNRSDEEDRTWIRKLEEACDTSTRRREGAL